jgi:hypothetical protein
MQHPPGVGWGKSRRAPPSEICVGRLRLIRARLRTPAAEDVPRREIVQASLIISTALTPHLY